MNRRWFSFVPMLMALAAFADPTVDNLTVKQRWPWSGKVDIDFTLTADAQCDVLLRVSWHGCVSPLVITNGLFGGTLIGAPLNPGSNHLVFDPADFGLSGQTLGDFKVEAVQVSSVAERTWMVLDLSNGGYEFAAEPPEGGWNVDAYKGEKLVLRRVPAGDYEVGLTDAELTRLNETKAAKREFLARRTVTIGSEYYFSIFPVTAGHDSTVRGTAKTSGSTQAEAYDTLRGVASETINWPVGGHTVDPNSRFQTYRNRLNLPQGMILDLPTETQWEVAARAGTTTIYPNGGVVEDSDEQLRAYFDALGVHGAGANVGQKDANNWGIYDVLGVNWEWCLEGYNLKGTEQSNIADPDFRDPTQTVDPIGRVCTVDETLRRITCNIGYGNGLNTDCTTSYRAARATTGTNRYRLCIHLKPLAK